MTYPLAVDEAYYCALRDEGKQALLSGPWPSHGAAARDLGGFGETVGETPAESLPDGYDARPVWGGR